MSDLWNNLHKLDGRIVVVGNKMPDADSISSALALVHALKFHKRDAVYYMPESPKDYK